MKDEISKMIQNMNFQFDKEVTLEELEEMTGNLKLIDSVKCGINDEDTGLFYNDTGTVPEPKDYGKVLAVWKWIDGRIKVCHPVPKHA